MLHRTLIAAAGAAAMMLPATIAAQDLTAREQTMLDALSPEMRDYIMSRMGPDQTVQELIETTILNALADEYAYVEDVDYTADAWDVVVIDDAGVRETVIVDYDTIGAYQPPM
jgi:hypothetical protein